MLVIMLLLTSSYARQVDLWAVDAEVITVDSWGILLGLSWTAQFDVMAGGTLTTAFCTATEWAPSVTTASCRTSADEASTPIVLKVGAMQPSLSVTLNGVEVRVIEPPMGGKVRIPGRELGVILAQAASLGPGPDSPWDPGPMAIGFRPTEGRTAPAITISHPERLSLEPWKEGISLPTTWQCSAIRARALPVEGGPTLSWWLKAITACKPSLALLEQRDAACDRAEAAGAISTDHQASCEDARDDEELLVSDDDITWVKRGLPGYPEQARSLSLPPVSCRAWLHVDVEGKVTSTAVDECPQLFADTLTTAFARWQARPIVYRGRPYPFKTLMTFQFELR